MSKRILIVDDNPSDSTIASFVVEQLEYVPTVFEDGFAALDSVMDEENNFDLAIIDLQMPKMSGMELVQRIRRVPRLKSLPILIMSARNEAKDIRLAIKSGAADYIVKPVDPSVLKSKIENLAADNQEAWATYEFKEDEPVMAQMLQDIRMISLSELSTDVLCPCPAENGDVLVIDLSILGTDDLNFVSAKVTQCTQSSGGYRLRLSFIGLKEAQRKTIRLYCRSRWSQSREEAVAPKKAEPTQEKEQ